MGIESGGGGTGIVAANNLSDLADAATARGNLGISAFGASLVDDLTAAAARTTLGVNSSAETAALLPQPNLLINADGTNPVNQRGVADDAAIAHGDFTVDRWRGYSDAIAGGGTIDCRITAGVGFGLTCVDAGTGAYLQFNQVVEDYAKYKGRALTIFASVKSNAATRLRVYDGVDDHIGTDIHDGDDDYQTLVMKFTLNSSATGINAMLYIPSGLQTDDYFELAWIGLVPGSVATPFVAALPSQNLLDCQRYLPAYNADSAGDTFPSNGEASANNAGIVLISLPVTARVAPTGIVVSDASHFTAFDGVTSTALTSITYNAASKDAVQVAIGVAGTPFTATQPLRLFMNNAAGYIYFTGAEL